MLAVGEDAQALGTLEDAVRRLHGFAGRATQRSAEGLVCARTLTVWFAPTPMRPRRDVKSSKASVRSAIQQLVAVKKGNATRVDQYEVRAARVGVLSDAG